MEASKREEQQNVINLLETVLEQAKQGEFDKVIIICRFTDTQEVTAGWANSSLYDIGGMIMQGSNFIASNISSKEEEEADE